MITEKDTIKCEAIFNDEHTHRYLWRRVWNKEKPMVCVIMLNPCIADTIITDTTTTLVVNNIARLETFGGVEIVNLYSLVTNKLNFRWNSDEMLNDAESDNYIKNSAETVRIIFNMYSDGLGYTLILNELKRQDRKTKVGKDFMKNSLYSILTNPKYQGIYVFNRSFC